jgi:hypothetical protein
MMCREAQMLTLHGGSAAAQRGRGVSFLLVRFLWTSKENELARCTKRLTKNAYLKRAKLNLKAI